MSTPALLDKLRALERQLSATVDNCDGNYALLLRIKDAAADGIADLLPEIIGEMERNAADTARLDYLATRTMECDFSAIDDAVLLGFQLPAGTRVNNNVRDNIDAAKERT